jgi:hypothetical protein
LSELLVRDSVLGGLGVAAAVDGGGILFSLRGVVGASGWDDRRLAGILGLAAAAGDEDAGVPLRRGSFMADMHLGLAAGTGFSKLRGFCCKQMAGLNRVYEVLQSYEGVKQRTRTLFLPIQNNCLKIDVSRNFERVVELTIRLQLIHAVTCLIL